MWELCIIFTTWLVLKVFKNKSLKTCPRGQAQELPHGTAEQSRARSPDGTSADTPSTSAALAGPSEIHLNYAIEQMCSVGHGQLCMP